MIDNKNSDKVKQDRIRREQAERTGWTSGSCRNLTDEEAAEVRQLSEERDEQVHQQNARNLTDEEAAEVRQLSEERDEQVHQQNARMERFLSRHGGYTHNEFNSRELYWINEALNYEET